MKIGTIIKVVKSNGYEDQADISNLIGKEFKVIGHWKQKDNNWWNEGDIIIDTITDGHYMINSTEYEVVK